jgi:30S ribosomal protein S31
MGRGDRKTKKGKISIRSYGNARSHTAKKAAVGAKKAPVAKAAVAKKAAAAPAKKAPAKKSA